MAVKGSIICELCKQPVPVELQRAGDAQGGQVLMLVLSAAPLLDHMRGCMGAVRPELPAPVKSVPDSDLAGRIHQMLDMGAYVVQGASRACTMCGTKGAACLAALSKPGKQDACCPACGVGNTHPAPGELESCSVWATAHGATP